MRNFLINSNFYVLYLSVTYDSGWPLDGLGWFHDELGVDRKSEDIIEVIDKTGNKRDAQDD